MIALIIVLSNLRREDLLFTMIVRHLIVIKRRRREKEGKIYIVFFFSFSFFFLSAHIE
jgi:hypothetical protein